MRKFGVGGSRVARARFLLLYHTYVYLSTRLGWLGWESDFL